LRNYLSGAGAGTGAETQMAEAAGNLFIKWGLFIKNWFKPAFRVEFACVGTKMVDI
jgi:hypothetical protein